jgi:hypothetical protein
MGNPPAQAPSEAPNPQLSAESLASRRRDAARVPQRGAVERFWHVRPSAEEHSLQLVVHASCRKPTSRGGSTRLQIGLESSTPRPRRLYKQRLSVNPGPPGDSAHEPTLRSRSVSRLQAIGEPSERSVVAQTG